MLGGVKMLCGVLVLRGVATANVAAGKAEAEMHPTVAHFEAFLAALGLRLDAPNLIEVRALIGHVGLLWNYSEL
jgi:hypothetical protein